MSLENALQKYLGSFQNYQVNSEKIQVTQANGRVTAEPIFAIRNAPHFQAAAMDGIAVRAKDTAGATERNPIQLVEGRNAVWVDTGAPIPTGFDAVIMVEEINKKNESILEIERAASPWQHVRNIGESAIQGQLILPVNHKITGYDLGALLEAGLIEIEVWKKPTIGIIPTGSELVKPEKTPEVGELIEFNSSMLKAYTEDWGGIPSITEIVVDDYHRIKESVIAEINQHDLVVIIAGSSAGEEDYTLKILQELGEVVVHGVNIMPGKPVILAIVNGKPVIGIPGYPLAALFNYYLFVKPLIYQMTGLSLPETAKAEAVIKRKIPSKIGLTELVRVNLAYLNNNLVAVPGQKGSAAMKSIINADAIMPIAEQKEGVSPGERLPVYLLKPERKIKRNLLLIGSHDLSLDILKNKLQAEHMNFELNLQSVGSLGGLMALKRREAHLAGAHLFDEKTGDFNISFVQKFIPEQEMALINLVYRQQGLFVLSDNPKQIQGIRDLKREDVRFINRQRGAGTRVLLDYWLQKEGISSEEVIGYNLEETTHVNAAIAVASGKADTALGILAAAKAFNLDFIPLSEERYDLVLPATLLDDERIQTLLQIINSPDYKNEVELLGGYRTDQSGEIRLVARNN